MVTFFSFPSPMMVVALNIQCVQKLGLEVEVCSIKYNKNMATTSHWQHLQKFNSTVDLSILIVILKSLQRCLALINKVNTKLPCSDSAVPELICELTLTADTLEGFSEATSQRQTVLLFQDRVMSTLKIQVQLSFD